MSRGLDVESSFYLRVIDPNYLYSSHPYPEVERRRNITEFIFCNNIVPK